MNITKLTKALGSGCKSLAVAALSFGAIYIAGTGTALIIVPALALIGTSVTGYRMMA